MRIDTFSGNCRADHEIVSYQSMGIERLLTLYYYSQTASGLHILNKSRSGMDGGNGGLVVSVRNRSGKTNTTSVSGTTMTSGGQNERLRLLPSASPTSKKKIKVGTLLNLQAKPTGIYRYTLKLSSVAMTGSGNTRTITAVTRSLEFPGDVYHIQRIGSYWGHGWSLSALSELHDDPDDRVILCVNGDNSVAVFEGLDSNGNRIERVDVNTPAALAASYRNRNDADPSVLVCLNPTNSTGRVYQRTFPNGTVHNYTNNRISSIVDRNGNTFTFTYNGSGQIQTIQDPSGLGYSFAYPDSATITITDPASRVTTLTKASGRLIKITNPDGAYRSFGYTGGSTGFSHLLNYDEDLKYTADPIVKRECEYNEWDRVFRATQRDGGTILFSDPQSATMGGFNESLNISTALEVVSANTTVAGTTYELDKHLHAAGTYTDANQNTSTIYHNKSGQAAFVRDALHTQQEFDQVAKLSSCSDCGRVYSQRTARFGSGTTPLNAVNIAYDSNGNVLSVQDTPEANATAVRTFKYEPASTVSTPTFAGLIEEVDQEGGKTEFVMDYVVSSGTRRKGNVERIIKHCTTPNSSGATTVKYVTDFFYNSKGLVTKVIDWKTFNSDLSQAHGTQATSALRTDFVYNSQDRVSTIRYDVNTSGSSWDCTEAFTYDSSGNILTRTDRRGNVTTYTYKSGTNLVETVTLPDPDGTGSQTSSTMRYEYDAEQQKTKEIRVGSPNVTIKEWVRNKVAQTLQVIQPAIAAIASQPAQSASITLYSFDPNGNLVQITDPRGNVTTMTYDARNRFKMLTLPDVGSTSEPDNYVAEIEYVYDQDDNVVKEISRLANRTVNPVVFSDIRETDYEYDGRNRKIKAILPDPTDSTATTSFGYPDLPRPVLQTKFDKLNRVIGQISPGSAYATQISRTWYDSFGRVAEERLPKPNESDTWSYNIADGLATGQPRYRYRYDLTSAPVGMPTLSVGYVACTVENPEGQTSVKTYDKRSRLSAYRSEVPGVDGIIQAPSTTGSLPRIDIGWSYDDEDNIASHSYYVPNSSSTTPVVRFVLYTYDARNRLTRKTTPSPDGVISQSHDDYTYDQWNRLIGTIAPGNATTTILYDDRDRVLRVTYPDPDDTGSLARPEVDYAYDQAGNLVKTVDPMDREKTITYDSRNRVLRVTEPARSGIGSAYLEYSYNRFNAVTKTTNALGETAHYRLDALNRVIATSRNGDISGTNTEVVWNVYDEAGNLKAVHTPANHSVTPTDVKGYRTLYTRDNLGRITSQEAPNGSTRSWSYNRLGQVTEAVDYIGRKVQYLYDSIARVKEEKWLNASNVLQKTIKPLYDLTGRLCRVEDLDSANTVLSRNSFTWDWIHRITTASNSGTQNTVDTTHAYTFNADRRLESIDVASGSLSRLYEYAVDKLNRTMQIKYTGSGIAPKARVNFSYNAADQLTGISRFYGSSFGDPNTAVFSTAYAYDSAGYLSSITHGSTAYNYGYNLGNKQTSKNIPSGSAAIVYGTSNYNKDEVVSVDYSGQTDETFSWDEAGCLNGWTYNVRNQLTSDGNYNYEYDAIGNLIRKTTGVSGETWRYEYDHRNRMTLATRYPSLSSTTANRQLAFYYDIFNRRIRKVYDPDSAIGLGTSSEQRYVYDGENVSLISNGSAITQRYIHGVQQDQQILREAINGTTFTYSWAEHDNLNTVSRIVNNSAVAQNTTTYSTFGGVTSETSSANSWHYKFTGREYDSEMGLYYYRARYYDPRTYRFLSEDPLSFAAGDHNLYRYCFNRPQQFRDPSGMIVPLLVGAAIAGAVVGGGLSLAREFAVAADNPGYQVNPMNVLAGAAGGALLAPLGLISSPVWGWIPLGIGALGVGAGLGSAGHQFACGNNWTGALDAATAVAGIAGLRGAGRMRSPARGGPRNNQTPYRNWDNVYGSDGEPLPVRDWDSIYGPSGEPIPAVAQPQVASLPYTVVEHIPGNPGQWRTYEGNVPNVPGGYGPPRIPVDVEVLDGNVDFRVNNRFKSGMDRSGGVNTASDRRLHPDVRRAAGDLMDTMFKDDISTRSPGYTYEFEPSNADGRAGGRGRLFGRRYGFGRGSDGRYRARVNSDGTLSPYIPPNLLPATETLNDTGDSIQDILNQLD